MVDVFEFYGLLFYFQVVLVILVLLYVFTFHQSFRKCMLAKLVYKSINQARVS